MDIRVLGNVEIHGERATIRLARASERCVLAVLALNAGRPVPAMTLADHLWATAEQSDRALNTVGDYVRRVRAAVKRAGGSPDSLRTDRGSHSYVLDVAADQVDYLRFTELAASGRNGGGPTVLRQALALWRGPALADVTGLWADRRRYAMEAERLALYEEVLAADLAAGRHAEVVREITTLVDETVPTERLILLGARALAESGQHGAVRGWADLASRRLQDATGATIGAATAARIAEFAAAAGTKGAPAMFSLRGDVAGFTGRGDEIDRLLDAVDRDCAQAVAIHAVDGMPGIGKTAFSVHVAHRLAERYPDGQLFVELHGHTPGTRPVTPEDALASLLLSTGLEPAALPSGLDDRARLWRSQVAGLRVLIVLDDVADHDQVRPLLPGAAGSLVLLTSRHQLPALDSTVHLTLNVLPHEQAVRMLTRLAGIGPDHGDPDAAAEVVELCGRLPLAIALAAGQLRSHPTWTVRYLADQLAAADSRLERLSIGDRSVEIAFDMSLHALPPNQQRLLRLLGAHPGPEVDVYAVAALLDSDLTEARRCLEGLHADHILDETAPGRYQMHDLVRAFARLRAEDLDREDRDQALSRVLGYYVHTTASASAHSSARPMLTYVVSTTPPRHGPVLADADSANAWLAQELTTLIGCVEQAASDGHQRAAMDLAVALHPFLRIDRWTAALVIYDAALTAAVRIDDRSAQANFHACLGNFHRTLADFDKSAAHLRTALDLADDLDDRWIQAFVRKEMATIRSMTGDFSGAYELLTEACRLFTDLGDDFGRANALKLIGACHYYLGHFDLAMSTLTEARELLAKLGHLSQEADTLKFVATVLRARGEVQAAHDIAVQAVELAEKSGYLQVLGLALVELGEAERDLGRREAAIATLSRAVELFTEVGFRAGVAGTNTMIAAIHVLLDQHEAAAELLNRALAEQEELGVRGDVAETLIALGRLARHYPQAGDAEAFCRRALAIVQEIGPVTVEIQALTELARCGVPDGPELSRRAKELADGLG
jgi:tetratricopeptide (TPR) repeat protein